MDERMIDKFGAMIDELLEKEEIWLQLILPEGSMVPEIKSCFGKLGRADKATMDLYILLHGIAYTVKELIETTVDKERTPKMLDGIFELVKGEILREVNSDSGDN